MPISRVRRGPSIGGPSEIRSARQGAPKKTSPPLPYADLQLVVERVPVASLKPYKRRLRKPSAKSRERLQASLQAFGQVLPILVDASNVVLGGEAVLEALKTLGMSHICVVRASHLSEAQGKALRLALNRLPELNPWDHAELALEFKELIILDQEFDLDFDLAVTGFEHAEMDQVIAGQEAAPGDADDALPPLEEGVVSQLGDVWEMDEHRIICGDARDEAVYQALLGEERAAMASHDPPYNVKIAGNVSRSGRHGEFVMGSGEMSQEKFTAFLSDVLRMSTAVVRPGGSIFVFMDWRHMTELMAAAQANGLIQRNLCIWNKGSGAMGSFYRSQHELVFAYQIPGGAAINNILLGKFGRNRTNVWDFPGAPALRAELKLHATPKPVALVAEVIRDCSHRGDIVLDAFSGSGTTIIAAARTGRRARVIELDPRFVDVAVRRWQEWSGKPARHARTGLSFAERAASRAQAQMEPSPEAAAADRRAAIRALARQRLRA